MPDDTIAVKAYVPRALKRQAFAALQLEDSNFSAWTREHLANWLKGRTAPAHEPKKAEQPAAKVSV